ncbi:hypothetical protein AM571_PB00004 (plasmid) [Rhizobium etli 8C-3]|uniref:Uncharacterized protein n=1 Tax=Rhizobium etli 8C-3 TaxID=538025 RepID=A0A1L5PB07_RHIET|nr:hypothetical protein AM571_PB00004 [Rhizobium etli 8C-3]MBB4333181.1 hypothetical protein [Rhizobium leguminosarum]MBB4358745.1 hypothetical protein [Rhizobium leguminosarum]MBB4553175.1 hypothetical protein [Rhizobium leguminosarum]MBB4565699.1 hypothetical protein [Rhizobium leguminosarum]
MRDLANERWRFGDRRPATGDRRPATGGFGGGGSDVGVDRIYGLYREEGLSVRKQKSRGGTLSARVARSWSKRRPMPEAR